MSSNEQATADEQEALNRKYSNDLILLLPLSSGNVAVFNTARELCGIVIGSRLGSPKPLLRIPPPCWHPPTAEQVKAAANTVADLTIEALKKAGLL